MGRGRPLGRWAATDNPIRIPPSGGGMDGRGPLVGTGFSLRRLEMPFWVRLLHTETHDLKLINAEHIGTQ